VVQARDPIWLWGAVLGLPGVEAEVVVVATGGQKQKISGRAPSRNVTGLGDDIEPSTPT